MTAPMDRALGLEIDAIPTPSLVLDLDVFESNCQTISGYLSAQDVEWRPHIKGHKSPRLAGMMIEAGAIGVTCAKVGEAEVMAEGGITEILLANQPGTEDAWDRLARLQHLARVSVAVDGPRHVELAVEAGARHGVEIPLLVEVDVGMDRAGVRSASDALSLARTIHDSPTQFRGLMGYEGHLLTIDDLDEKSRVIGEAIGKLIAAANLIEDASIPVEIVSCGGSGSYEITAQIDGVTEIQAGGGCLMDRFYEEQCGVNLQNALFIVTSVTSRPSSTQAILDAGWKAASDRLARPKCHGRDDVHFSQIYAEHMRVDVPATDGPSIGERLTFVPGYSDATTVLYDEMLGVRDGVVVEVLPLTARGALQ